MDINRMAKANLLKLNLSEDESAIYLELVGGPSTHLRLSRKTGINRSKVYRVVEQLEKRSLVSRRVDDRGMFVLASDPSALEIELIDEEERVKQKRNALREVTSHLEVIRRNKQAAPITSTYTGVAGFKQMQWHELKTSTEVLVLGNVTVEQLVDNRQWAERFRALSVSNGHRTQEVINVPYQTSSFTENEAFVKLYEARIVPQDILPALTPMVIYDDTVAIYQFTDKGRLGIEIVNTSYAQTMRYIFERYWNLNQIDIRATQS